MEAQCECGAGVGLAAHCKHIQAILYAVNDLTTHGKIKLRLACTQKIQSFHRSKIFLGSAVKAQALPLGHVRVEAEDSSSNSSVGMKKLRFDPRPAASQNSCNYTDYVHNVTINYKSFFTDSLPLSQLFVGLPANPYAVELDHDYLDTCIIKHEV